MPPPRTILITTYEWDAGPLKFFKTPGAILKQALAHNMGYVKFLSLLVANASLGMPQNIVVLSSPILLAPILISVAVSPA